ncbi:MAG: hypothetical protein ACFHWZ_11950 [Phycisphaerales bacterium]
MADDPQPDPPPAPDQELIAFLAGRSFPCPRCAYDLRDIRAAVCPECAEPLILTIGTPRVRFGWLIVAMVPGSFSGVAAMFLAVPITVSLWYSFPSLRGVPWPMLCAEAFGITSAASVVLMYRRRLAIFRWTTRRQAAFAAGVWAVHIGAFVLLIAAMALWF